MKKVVVGLRSTGRVMGCLVLLAGTAVLLTAQESKIAPDLAGLGGEEEMDVIIQYNEPEGRRGGGRQPFSFSLPAGVSSRRPVRELGLIGAISARVTGSSVATLAADSRVKYISPDREVSASQFAWRAVGADVAQAALTPSNPYGSGAGIGVAIIDSGLNPHNDLRACPNFGSVGPSRVVYAQNFVTTENTTADLYGHGSHVAGMAAGDGRCVFVSWPYATVPFPTSPTAVMMLQRFQLFGVAPGANLINLRVLDKDGKGTDANVIAAIDRAIALKNTYNIRVINLSLGRMVKESYKLDPLCQAVERAWNAGIVVVVAAGNNGRVESVKDKTGKVYPINGYGTIGSPGNDPFVITVGVMRDMFTATRNDDLVASFSSKGPTPIDRIVKPDIMAPGNRTLSLQSVAGRLATAFPTNIPQPASYGVTAAGTCGTDALCITQFNTAVSVGQKLYLELSGTSMSAPIVAGAAALMVQKFGPTITPDVIKARLMKTAAKIFSTNKSSYLDASTNKTVNIQYDMFTVGAGYLDIVAALNNTDVIPTGRRALSPGIIRSCDPGKTTGCVKLVHPTGSAFTSSTLWTNPCVG